MIVKCTNDDHDYDQNSLCVINSMAYICDCGCGIMIPDIILDICNLPENIPENIISTDIEWINFKERVNNHIEHYEKYKNLSLAEKFKMKQSIDDKRSNKIKLNIEELNYLKYCNIHLY
jgi:hypothetical protein